MTGVSDCIVECSLGAEHSRCASAAFPTHLLQLVARCKPEPIQLFEENAVVPYSYSVQVLCLCGVGTTAPCALLSMPTEPSVPPELRSSRSNELLKKLGHAQAGAQYKIPVPADVPCQAVNEADPLRARLLTTACCWAGPRRPLTVHPETGLSLYPAFGNLLSAATHLLVSGLPLAGLPSSKPAVMCRLPAPKAGVEQATKLPQVWS
jgi:hypothetical protein